ncbi:asparagine synthase [Burkholderia sp. Bp9090]|nr:asparagine synthase [Burkholderia sp. Bp9090]
MGCLAMKLWTIVVNGTTVEVDAYIDDLLDALGDVQVDSAKRMAHGWATLIEMDIRLCEAECRSPRRIDTSAGDTAYSGWLRDLHSGTLHSSFRQDALALDPSKNVVLGEFSYASIRPERVILMTDHYATHPIYYWCGKNGQWVASNDLRLLLLCRLVPLKIRRESCIEFLTQSVMVGENELAGEATFFAEVLKMPASGVLSIDRTGQTFELTQARDDVAFRLDSAISRREDFEQVFRARLDACVLDRIEAGAGGIMLSGGVDSNTVLGATLSVHGRSAPFCANMGFRDADLAMSQDDKLVEALVRHCDVPHRIIYADDFLRLPALDDACAYVDGPDAAANPLAKEACARVFQDHDVSLVMTGEGGDVILGESTHPWILDSIREHDGIEALHDYVTENLGIRAFSRAYFHKMLTSLSPRLGRREWLEKESTEGRAILPDYLGKCLLAGARRQARAGKGYARHSRTRYLGHDYIRAMLFPRATYFDTLNVYCTHSHPFLDPRMISFALACPPHLHHDYRRLNRANPYATSKMLARNAYRGALPDFATEKKSKTSYALMARRMFRNSAGALRRLTDRPMILNDWGLVDQARFRRHLTAYIVATEDPNAQLGTQYHYIRGVTDLEAWLVRFSGARATVVKHLKFRPLRALAG